MITKQVGQSWKEKKGEKVIPRYVHHHLSLHATWVMEELHELHLVVDEDDIINVFWCLLQCKLIHRFVVVSSPSSVALLRFVILQLIWKVTAISTSSIFSLCVWGKSWQHGSWFLSICIYIQPFVVSDCITSTHRHRLYDVMMLSLLYI